MTFTNEVKPADVATEASTRARYMNCVQVNLRKHLEEFKSNSRSRCLLDQDGDAEVDGATLELLTPAASWLKTGFHHLLNTFFTFD